MHTYMRIHMCIYVSVHVHTRVGMHVIYTYVRVMQCSHVTYTRRHTCTHMCM